MESVEITDEPYMLITYKHINPKYDKHDDIEIKITTNDIIKVRAITSALQGLINFVRNDKKTKRLEKSFSNKNKQPVFLVKDLND